MNYQQLVMNFIKKYSFASAEWSDDELTCFSFDGEPFGSAEYIDRSEVAIEWDELEAKLRAAKLKPFTVDVDVYDYEEGDDE